ncbi:hypothetical protein ERO13_D13G138701v2, partial [Gossypium hirsutum]
KATYKKRIKGLKNKIRELSTLCGIDTCAIMYNPYKSQPEVWPSPVVVQQILSKLKTISEMEKSKNMMNQKTFLSQKITKVMINNICSKEVIHGLNFGAFSDINILLDKKMSDIDKWIEALSRAPLNPQGVSSLSSSSMVVLPSMTMVTPENMDPMQRQEWIMDLMSNNNNNPQTHVGGDEIMFQFGDNINPNNGLCSMMVLCLLNFGHISQSFPLN